jgi:hypothetical protein
MCQGISLAVFRGFARFTGYGIIAWRVDKAQPPQARLTLKLRCGPSGGLACILGVLGARLDRSPVILPRQRHGHQFALH